MPPPGNINFAHPDFAMRIKKEPEQFWYSYDRGHTWKGPHNFGQLMNQSNLKGKEFTARTDYIVNGQDDCLVFLSATRGKSGSDFTFTATTTDGGRTFDFLSWIVSPTDPHRGVMPATVRCSNTKLVTAIRRRQGGGKPCWVDVYASNDNARSWSFLSKVGETKGPHATGGVQYCHRHRPQEIPSSLPRVMSVTLRFIRRRSITANSYSSGSLISSMNMCRV
jgi:hypothetical protein